MYQSGPIFPKSANLRRDVLTLLQGQILRMRLQSLILLKVQECFMKICIVLVLSVDVLSKPKLNWHLVVFSGMQHILPSPRMHRRCSRLYVCMLWLIWVLPFSLGSFPQNTVTRRSSVSCHTEKIQAIIQHSNSFGLSCITFVDCNKWVPKFSRDVI